MSFAAIALAAGLLAQDPAAQTPPAQDPTALSDVVVEARRLRAVVQDFVGEVSAPAGNRGPARWNGPVCVGVVNLRGEVAQYIVDRTSDVARELGLSAGEPGCAPNILIIAASDGRAVADAIVDTRRGAFRPGGSGMTRSLRALDAFRTSDAPIRWWHVSAPVDSETGALATRLPGHDAPTTNVSRASRIRTDIRDDLLKSIIIVDMTKVSGLTLTQLADYCALVALSQVDPDADVSAFDTILNVFADTDTPGLSSWDMDYLKALYSVEQNSVGASARGGEIVNMMARSRLADEAAPDAE
jgi:hypothetical protein